jgi:DNA gyrase subunit A
MDEGSPKYELARRQERAHILGAVLQAIDQFDTVVAAVRSTDSEAAARTALMGQLKIDEVQARAVAGMQILQLARRDQLASEYEGLRAEIAELQSGS